jgi:hypothetical protein
VGELLHTGAARRLAAGLIQFVAPRLPGCLQLLVRSKSVAGLAPLTVRLEVTHVKLRGRLRLGLVLGQEPPGIL